MSRVFPANVFGYVRLVGFVLTALAVLVLAGVTYYATPKYTRVGYEPIQPVRFSHKLHAGQLGMDCTYCHQHVGSSPHSNVPSLRTCMNCHGPEWGNIRPASAALAPLREAWKEGRPVPWVWIHRLPDYAYFHHAVHVARGVSCVSCHGRVDEMEVVRHEKPLSMAWCLDCHRDPGPHLRPADEITNLAWDPEGDPRTKGEENGAFVRYLIDQAGVRPPTDCSGCHR